MAADLPRALDLATSRALTDEPAPRMAPVAEVPAVFDAAECARIIALHDTLGHDDAPFPGAVQPQGGTTRSHVLDHSKRLSDRTILVANEQTAWIYEKVASATKRVNDAAWGFDIAYIEPLQLLVYPSGGHIDWHSDLGDRGLTARRKVSATIHLSGPEDYEGGQLEVLTGGRVIHPTRALGQGIFFPSFQNHRVTRLTSGRRAVLIVWTIGARPLR